MATMLQWLGKSPSKKQKLSNVERREYEKTRHRSFQEGWYKSFTWLRHSSEENKMYCTLCEKFDRSENPSTFKLGTNNYKIDIVKKHEKSETHTRSLERSRAASVSPGESIGEKTVVALNKCATLKLCHLFRNAHYVAKLGKPYTDYVSLCRLDAAKKIDIGSTYLTDKYCQQIISNIADTRRVVQRDVVQKANFISVISDGATDCASMETEIVYCRTSVGCEVSTFFVGIKHVRRADAVTISQAITSLLDTRFPDWREKIIAMGTDGASVMVGKKGGVVKIVSEAVDRPFLKGIHCSAHRLELAYKDATKKIPIHQRCELLLLNLYLFYKYSPLNRANLRASFESLGKASRVPTRMGGTRWLPHTKRALKQMLEGMDGIVLHLEQMQQQPQKESSCKAKNFLKVLKSPETIYWLHLMTDVIRCLSKVSETIQEKHSTVADIASELECAKNIIEKYKSSVGPCLRSMSPDSLLEKQMTERKTKLLVSLLTALTDRFSGDANLFLPAATLLSIKMWPDFKEELGNFQENEDKL
ncbi:zinc finger protein 862-like [Pecten maximus]|uniref:zinc finger protein 862-like n=1 Tax=Pecten maximus TaxID=6579 RepID=UPI001458B047|nr:zinc finger protein 862-like [Pecten maximus]